MLQHTEGTFTGTEGQLYWQAWKPDTLPKALLIIVHGFDDHSARYAHVAEYFAARGYSVYAFDQIGHGQSEGRRGHVMSFDHYVEDLNRFVALAQTREPDLKTFVYGHSQGGMIALRYGIAHPQAIQGVLTTGAGLILFMSPPAWKVTLGKLLANVMPTLTMGNEIPLEHLSHDPAVLASRKQDAHRHGVATARWANEFFSAQADTLAQAHRFTPPLLMLHGGDDRLISPAATRQFYAAAASYDKQMKIYDGMYHELCNEICKDDVLAEMERWLNDRVSR